MYAIQVGKSLNPNSSNWPPMPEYNFIEGSRELNISYANPEIAILGQAGLDYASPEQKYRLASLPGETFSGLQLMCLMYVGFKDIEPALDVGMDLSESYQMALQLFREED